VARYHRKSAPTKRHDAFAALAADDQRRVVVLSGLLRVAVGLDRNHGGRVAGVRATIRPEAVEIEVVPRPGETPELELFSARQRTGPLAAALDRRIDVELAEAPEPAVQ